MSPMPLPELPGMPWAKDGPVFSAPWEARAFAMVLALHERGLFTWPQWSQALARQIDIARQDGRADLGHDYYQYWLLALESLVNTLPA
ncbi:MAG TPA: nitrile hydratase accessory protein [Steroidobacteraceae bacterium]